MTSRSATAAVTFVAAVVMATAAGCTPPPDARVALATGAGGPEVLAYVCQGQEVSVVQVYETDAGPAPDIWEVRPPVGPQDLADEDYLLEFPVFEAPADWETVDRSLSRLERGVRYSVAFSTVEDQESVIRFTVETLEELAPGEVLTGRTDHEAAVSESEFIDAARDDCG